MTLEPAVREPLLAAIPKLRAFAISLCRSRDEAEDLVQTTLLRACANIASFEPGSNMIAWLFAILRNHFYSEYRRRRRSSELMGELAQTETIGPQQIDSVEYNKVCAALAKLEPNQRKALMLVGASGLSYDEAANMCDCPIGTIKSRVRRGRQELARMLSIESGGFFEADAVFSAVVANGDRVATEL